MRRYIFLLIAIILLLAQALPTITSGRFTFAFDMGRDLLWVRNMVELKKPTLIGPWGSIAGVYFGPLWYYLLAIPYIVLNGDPRAAVVIPLAANLLTIIIGWLFLRRRHKVAADMFALLYSVSPMIVSLSSFAFHANLLPLATLIIIIGLTNFSNHLNDWKISSQKSKSRIPISFFAAVFTIGLSYHLEPAAGAMLTGFLIVWMIGIILKSSRGRWHVGRGDPGRIAASSRPRVGTPRNENSLIRLLVYSLILFIIPFIPQVIFELRHDFIQTKSLVAYFQGENPSLGGVLPLDQRLTERIFKLSDTVSYSLLSIGSSAMKLKFAAIFLILIILSSVIPAKVTSDVAKAGIYSYGFRIKSGMTQHILRFTFYFLLFHYLAYVFFFPAELKSWYLFGFASLFVLTASLIVEQMFVRRRIIGISAAAGLILWNTNGFIKLIPQSNQPAAPETLAAQLDVVDWIYQDAFKSAEPFSVYTYTPPIYDYSYQYLIWWRGTNRHGKLPAEFSYLPGETSYLPEKEIFVSSDWKPEDAKVAYLIIEPDSLESRQQGWLGHFAFTAFVSKIDFPSGVTVEKRYKL